MRDFPPDVIHSAVSQSSPFLGLLLDILMADSTPLGQLPHNPSDDNIDKASASLSALNRPVHTYSPTQIKELQAWTDESFTVREACNYIETYPEFLLSLNARASLHFLRNHNAPIQTPTPLLQSNLNCITWTMRGLQSKAQAISTLINDHKPLILALTETHLRPHEIHLRFVAQCIPGYTLYTSSHSQPNLLISMPRDPANAHSSALPYRSRHAGVILAIRSDWTRPHLVHRFQTPHNLESHLVHICIRMPDSKPLHIFANYRSKSAG